MLLTLFYTFAIVEIMCLQIFGEVQHLTIKQCEDKIGKEDLIQLKAKVNCRAL